MDTASYFALDINNAGRIVGETQIIPLRGFVTLRSALFINDRGEIVASGTDSRTQSLGTYFLEPVRR